LNQRCFFTTAPVFDLLLAVERLDFGLILFGINEINRAVFEGVRGTPAVIVRLQAGLEVVSGSDVKIGIGTAKDIDVMHAPNMGKFELSLNRGEQELPLDYSLQSRSRHHSPRRKNWLAMSEP